MTFHLEPLAETHFEQLHDLFDAVCRERRFLVFTEAGPIEQTFAYYRHVIAGQHAHIVAMRDQSVIGWCDVLPVAGQMRAHVGVLGLAVAASERRQGVGKALIQAAINQATERRLIRIELTVHSENQAAQALYQSVGFEHEGIQRRAWCLDGHYFDVCSMARLG